MRQIGIMVILVCIVLGSGCAMLAGSGITNSDALKDMIVRKAQEELAAKGYVFSTKDLEKAYDAGVVIAESPEAAVISDMVEANEAAKAKIQELLDKYLPKD